MCACSAHVLNVYVSSSIDLARSFIGGVGVVTQINNSICEQTATTLNIVFVVLCDDMCVCALASRGYVSFECVSSCSWIINRIARTHKYSYILCMLRTHKYTY